MAEARAPRRSGSFVGRREEFARLRLCVDESVSGNGGIALISGEPGIGKTRLAHEVAEYALSRRARVSWANCWEGEGAPPFWPWVQIVRDVLKDKSPSVLDRILRSRSSDLIQLVPEIRDLVPDARPPPPLAPEQARFRLFDAVSGFLAESAKAEPHLVVVDDLQWADTGSLFLLHFFAHHLGDSRILLVGIFRKDEFVDHPAAKDVLARLAPMGQAFALGGLSPAEVGRLVASTIGREPSEETVDVMFEQTEGNPFFVREVSRLLMAGEVGRGHPMLPGGVPVPEGVRDVLDRRLNRSSAGCIDTLSAAALIGQWFDLETLESVVQVGGEALLDRVNEALTGGLVSRLEQRPGRLTFSHALIRRALYEKLAVSRRVALHRAFADVLAARADREAHVAEIATHYFLAIPSGCVREAVEYGVRAAEKATLLLAYEEAASHYERAIEALAKLSPADESRLFDLLLAHCAAHARAGNGPEARKSFRRAASLADRVGGPERLAATALEVVGPPQVGRPDEPMTALLQLALERLEAEDTPTRAMLMARLGQSMYFSDQRRGAALSKEALEIARRLGDLLTIALCTFAYQMTIWGPDTLDESTRLSEALLRETGPSPPPQVAFLVLPASVALSLERGDVELLADHVDRCSKLSAQLRHPFIIHYSVVWRALLALIQGRIAAGARLAEEALLVGNRNVVRGLPVQDVNATVMGTVQRFAFARELGTLADLEGEMKAASDAWPFARFQLAYLYADVGRKADARREYDALAAANFSEVPRDFLWLSSMCLIADVAVALNDRPRAELLYRLLAPYAERNASVGGLACFGSVSRWLGVLAAGLQRWSDGRRHFDDAARMNERMNAPTFSARVLLDHASMLLDRDEPGDREEAVRMIEDAAQTARAAGATALVARSSQLRDAAGRPRIMASATPRFLLERKHWVISYEGETIRLRDSKGLRDLVLLLTNAGREFHAADMFALTAESAGLDRISGPSREDASAVKPSRRGSAADDHLDARARREYRNRLEELQVELDDAERMGDAVRAGRAREQIDLISAELARAYGLYGRVRRPGDPTERARKAVTWRIRDAIERIERVHPRLGRHLSGSIRTGTFCSYLADPPIRWVTS